MNLPTQLPDAAPPFTGLMAASVWIDPPVDGGHDAARDRPRQTLQCAEGDNHAAFDPFRSDERAYKPQT